MAQINFACEDELKRDFDALCNEIGTPVSVAMKVFMKKFVVHGGFPFDVVDDRDPTFTEKDIRILEQRYADYKAGRRVFVEHELIED